MKRGGEKAKKETPKHQKIEIPKMNNQKMLVDIQVGRYERMKGGRERGRTKSGKGGGKGVRKGEAKVGWEEFRE